MTRPGYFLVALILTAMAWAVTSWVGPAFWRQSASADWPSVSGVVVRSHLRTSTYTGKRGQRFSGDSSPDIGYTYRVGQSDYDGDRLRFSPLEPAKGTSLFSSADRGLVQQVVNAYPKGAQVAVYYDPHDPRVSLLLPGRTPLDWWCLMVPLAVWSLAGAAWAQAALGPWQRVGGLAVLVEGSRARLLHTATTVPAAALLTGGGGAMTLSFYGGPALFGGVFNPLELSPGSVELAYLVLAGLGLVAAVSRWLDQVSDKRDVVVDADKVHFPSARGRQSVPRESLAGCEVVQVMQSNRNTSLCNVRLMWTSRGEPWGADVYSKLSLERASALTEWLRTQCGITLNTAPDFVSVLGVRLVAAPAAADVPQAMVILAFILVVSSVVLLAAGAHGFVWFGLPLAILVGMLWLRLARAQGLRSMAARNGWRCHDRMSDVPYAADLPPHFTMGIPPNESVVTTEDGRTVVVVSADPLLLMWDSHPLTTTFLVRLSAPASPFRCSRETLATTATQALQTQLTTNARPADPRGRTYHVVGLLEHELQRDFPEVVAWLDTHPGWDVTVWQHWLLCTKTPLVTSGHIMDAVDTVRELARAVSG